MQDPETTQDPATPGATGATGALAPSWQMLDRSLAATAASDLDGRLVYVNPAFLALWRFGSAAEVLGQPATGTFWADSQAAAAVIEALRVGGLWQGELLARRADGSTMPVWCSAHVVLGPGQQPTGLMASFTDRTAEVEAARALQAERGFVETIIGAAGVLVLVLDEQGRFVRFNRECERVSGWRAEELLGRTPWDTVLPPEAVASVRADAFERTFEQTETGAGVRHTNEWLARDGARRLIEWTNRVLAAPDGAARYMVSIGVDVTERHAAERALQDSESRLRQAQQVARLGSWTLDLASGALLWSDEVYRLFELERADFGASYAAFLGFVHPDDRAALDAAYAESLRTRQPYLLEHRLLMPDGRVKWVEERGESEFDAAGRPLRSLGTVQDVTERHEAQAAAAAREAQLRATLDAFPGFVAAVDDDLRYLYVNERMARQLGVPRDGVVGQPVASLFGAAQHEELRQINARLLRGEAVAVERRIRVVDAGERIFSVAYRVEPDGQRPGRHVFFAFATDVTELRHEQRRLSAIIEGTRTGTWEWVPAGGTLKVNARLAALLGHPVDALIAAPALWMSQAVHPDDRAARQLHFERLCAGTTESSESEFRVRDAAGGWTWILERGRVVERGDDGRAALVLGTCQDISALKRSQEDLQRLADDLEERVRQRTAELARATEEAQRASAAKTEFLSNMSHELRTPLNAIIGFGQLLDPAALPGPAGGYVDEILRAGRHLLGLINEMLDLSAVEAGSVQLAPALVPLAPLVEEGLALIGPEAQRAEVALVAEIGACDAAWADAGRLRQVLLNLLSNAVKYNRRGGSVTVSVRPVAGGGCELAVADTGPGLTPAQIERLFRPFERLDSAQLAIPGTGIGLSLCKRLVELMGGYIGVDSTPGRGSRFWVVLPPPPALAPPLPPARPAPAPAIGPAAPAAAGTAGLDVLYVEDNPANLRLMEHLMALRPAVRLHTAADGDTGLERALAVRPGLILVDIQLPGMDGYALLARLRSAGLAAPAVAVSANAMPADLAHGRAAGFADYLTKPLDLQRVLALVDAALAGAGG